MSQHLPALRPAKVLKALERAGFYIHHTNGSHHFLKHPDKSALRVTISMHNTDIKRKTLVSSSSGPATVRRNLSNCSKDGVEVSEIAIPPLLAPYSPLR
jgi:predicted RNA binding protein YcfA (HicA-like mRNA interferase family)